MHTMTLADIAKRSEGMQIVFAMTATYYVIYYDGKEWTTSPNRAWLAEVCEAMKRDVHLIIGFAECQIWDFSRTPIMEDE